MAVAFLAKIRSWGFNAPTPERRTPLLVGRDRGAAQILELEARCG